jgi:hypothetical protein
MRESQHCAFTEPSYCWRLCFVILVRAEFLSFRGAQAILTKKSECLRAVKTFGLGEGESLRDGKERKKEKKKDTRKI